MKHRMFWMLLGISFVLLIYAAKLFTLQVLAVGSLSGRDLDLVKGSVNERQEAIVLSSGRGDLLDRSLRPLTGFTYPALLIFPLRRPEDALKEKVPQLCQLLGTNEADWTKFASELTVPAYWHGGEATGAGAGLPYRLSAMQADAIRRLAIPGVVVADYRQRYLAPYPAAQLIGFTAQDPERARKQYWRLLDQGRIRLDSKIGASGLEKSFEPFLAGLGPTTLSLFTDAAHRELAGLQLRQTGPDNPYYPLKVVTTLDLPTQQKIESILDSRHVADGAVVVLDAANADVVAMGSRPAYDPDQVDPQANGWAEKALQGIVPGSIFKTAVAAAALETGAAGGGETFTCNGELGKYGFSCWKPGGHGTLTFEEAYAESCNITFAKVMERMPSATLIAYANKLGLLQTNGWTGHAPDESLPFHQFDQEQVGQVFNAQTDASDDGVRVQTAIGQRDVRMTPLAAANLVVTLLHGGEVLEPRVVSAVDYQTGRTLATFPSRVLIPKGKGISAQTAGTLTGWMRDVVDYGTGKGLQKAKWPLAGKSGTAQETADGKGAVTQWFIGYGPYPDAKYAVAVVVQHTPANSEGIALGVFRDVMDALASATGGHA